MIEPRLHFLFTVLFLSMLYGHFDNSAPFAHAQRENVSAQHKSHRFISQIPRRRDETRLYVRRVNQRDIKSKIHSTNETDLPDKGIKEQDLNKGDTTNGGKE